MRGGARMGEVKTFELECARPLAGRHSLMQVGVTQSKKGKAEPAAVPAVHLRHALQPGLTCHRTPSIVSFPASTSPPPMHTCILTATRLPAAPSGLSAAAAAVPAIQLWEVLQPTDLAFFLASAPPPPTHVYLQMWQQYQPCGCEGPCNPATCKCAEGANYCEKFCG